MRKNKKNQKRRSMIRFESAHLARNDKIILNNFNLHIKENDKVLIQGKSGIGKTTLFKILLGFETLDKGNAYFNGQSILKETIKNIRGQIFYLSQDIDLKNKRVTTLLDEILEFNHLTSSKNDLEDLLQILDLNTQILDQNVKELSGGERQRLGLLIGFLLDRPVWLLDEPTSALDDTMKELITNYILSQDKTIVIISHDEVWKLHPEVKPATLIKGRI